MTAAPTRTLIVEDEWLARSYLVELLQGTGLAEVVAAVATLAEAEQALDAASAVGIDAAFVDIQLAGRPGDDSGLAWVREKSGRVGAPRFVLATASKQHAVEAFELGVADYLVKPFTEERVLECLHRLRGPGTAIRAHPPPTKVVARRQRALVFLELDEVWACEAAERLTYVHSSRGRFDLDLTLSAIAQSFGRTLLRVQRNWLINPARVLELERLSGETTLLVGVPGSGCDALRVPVSRDRTPAIRELLMANSAGVRKW